MNKLKYLSILILPISAYISFTSTGILTFLPLLITFFAIPVLELFFKPNKQNLSETEAESAKNDAFYKALLFLMVPIQITALLFFFQVIQEDISTIDFMGRISTMGILCGVLGINVGHELGHSSNRFERFLGEIMLLTSLETHFLPYHNTGHHFDVATPEDAATARKNEWIYLFWFRSQIGSYFKAWKLEKKRLTILKKSVISINNKMIIYTIAQISLLLTIYFFYGTQVLLYFIIVAIYGIMLLECVNYIEHYGLLRKKKKSGRYEVVSIKHSWNSDHTLGRILLFELSRHSDHHHRANKSYQLLDSYEDSPQMFTGYPGMMILALFPPLWFAVMNKKLPKNS